MFIVALFTIAMTWKQPKCPSVEEWIKKMWYIYTMKYYSVVKRNEIGSFVEMWMDHTEWNKSDREKQILYINAYTWNLEKWYRWSYLQNRNRATVVENKRMDTKAGKGRGWDELGDLDWHIYTIDTMYKIDN